MARIAYRDVEGRALDPSLPASEVYMISERELEPIIRRFQQYADHYGPNRLGIPALMFVIRMQDALTRFGAETFDGSLHPSDADEGAYPQCPTCGKPWDGESKRAEGERP